MYAFINLRNSTLVEGKKGKHLLRLFNIVNNIQPVTSYLVRRKLSMLKMNTKGSEFFSAVQVYMKK